MRLCVCVQFEIFHLLTQHQTSLETAFPAVCVSPSPLVLHAVTDVHVTHLGALTLCLGVHLASAMALLPEVCTKSATYVRETAASTKKESALNRNVAAIPPPPPFSFLPDNSINASYSGTAR